MNDTQRQIIRQSSLKSAVEWANGQDRNYTLSEVIGITMGFEQYCVDGSFELINRIDKKITKRNRKIITKVLGYEAGISYIYRVMRVQPLNPPNMNTLTTSDFLSRKRTNHPR
mgnify:CR=1 FL=1